MTGADKVVCQAATLLLLFALTSMPAKAQFAGLGGGGEDMMTQMAPMLEMMKGKGIQWPRFNAAEMAFDRLGLVLCSCPS